MKSWAFVVGINEYHPEAGQSQLHGAVDDAADFADWALHGKRGSSAAGALVLLDFGQPRRNPSPALAKYLKTPTRWCGLSNSRRNAKFRPATFCGKCHRNGIADRQNCRVGSAGLG